MTGTVAPTPPWLVPTAVALGSIFIGIVVLAVVVTLRRMALKNRALRQWRGDTKRRGNNASAPEMRNAAAVLAKSGRGYAYERNAKAAQENLLANLTEVFKKNNAARRIQGQVRARGRRG